MESRALHATHVRSCINNQMLNYANSKYFIQSLNTICYHESSGLTSHLSKCDTSLGAEAVPGPAPVLEVAPDQMCHQPMSPRCSDPAPSRSPCRMATQCHQSALSPVPQPIRNWKTVPCLPAGDQWEDEWAGTSWDRARPAVPCSEYHNPAI